MDIKEFPNEKPAHHGACYCGCDKFYLITDTDGELVIAIQCADCGAHAAVMDNDLDDDDGSEIDVDLN